MSEYRDENTREDRQEKGRKKVKEVCEGGFGFLFGLIVGVIFRVEVSGSDQFVDDKNFDHAEVCFFNLRRKLQTNKKRNDFCYRKYQT